MARITRQSLGHGELHAPEGPGPFAAILVLSGSDGGIGYARFLARLLAQAGFAALALPYFKAPGLPKLLADIPLEHFEAAVAELKNAPRIDPARIGVLGFSKGAEAALLIASRCPDITAVAAVAPSHVAWESLDYRGKKQRASWTEGGAAVPFVAYDKSKPFRSVLDLYERSLASATNLPEAAIPVERINGPVLLLSGDADGLWPSGRMAEKATARLAEKQFAHAHAHVSHAGAGHMILPLRGYRALMWGVFLNWLFGGTRRANAAARRDGFVRIVRFFAGMPPG